MLRTGLVWRSLTNAARPRTEADRVREDPAFDPGAIAACLEARYGVRLAALTFLPIGHDLNAAVYDVAAEDGSHYFLKIRTGPIFAPALLVPRALIELGVHNVLAPLRTLDAALWSPLDVDDGCTVVLYPFVRGENAKAAPMSDEQWRTFGRTLRAVHDSGLAAQFRGHLRAEDFALPSAAAVRRLLALVERTEFESAAAARFADFWRANAEGIRRLLARAEELGKSLQAKPFELALCHSDIHGANILVGEDGRIWLVDWDSPLIAPRERDLLFVVGSRIGRPVEPRHDDLFFEGYGPTEIDPAALVYYRYERAIEDLGEVGVNIFENPSLGEQTRARETDLIINLFAPNGFIDRLETVSRFRWPAKID
jgi:spectinomycin phosphotransferase